MPSIRHRNITSSKPRLLLLGFLLAWLVISAFYYMDQLFSPNFEVSYEEGAAHKVFKYVVCLILSISFCIAARAYILLYFCFSILIIAGLLALGNQLQIATLSMLIVGTMAPFMLIPQLWQHKLPLIARTIVFSGALVGLFSILELTVLATLFESAWVSIGGVRLASTLLNPNNLGLYAGVALIMLPFVLRGFGASVCGVLLLFAIIASGSRTAWVSILVVLFYAFLTSSSIRTRVSDLLHRHFLQFSLTLLLFAFAYATYETFRQPLDIETVYRGTDTYTLSVRWDNFLTFVDLIDIWLLLPDQSGQRADYIQDNFYLVLLNSFGVVGVLLLVVFVVAQFSLRRTKNLDIFPWKLVLIFYLVSGFSGSQLNSFPNNQLFFISIGSVLVYRNNSKTNKLSSGSLSAGKALNN